MLRDGERAERPVEGPPGAGDQLLHREGLEVHDPNPGHLVHRHQGTLERVVQGLVLGVGDGEAPDDLEALAEVGVPELVAAGEGLEGALVDDEALLERGIGPGDEVAPPQLEAEGVAQELLLIEQVVLRRVELLGYRHRRNPEEPRKTLERPEREEAESDNLARGRGGECPEREFDRNLRSPASGVEREVGRRSFSRREINGGGGAP